MGPEIFGEISPFFAFPHMLSEDLPYFTPKERIRFHRSPFGAQPQCCAANLPLKAVKNIGPCESLCQDPFE